MAVLEAKNIGVTIGAHRILRSISLSVERGQVVGLIGPNGSGKTTLFNVLSGFLKPSEGSIFLNDKEITRLSPAKRAHAGLGRVFQNFGIFRDMTLEENVLVALEAMPKNLRPADGEKAALVSKTLDMVGLGDHAKKKAGSLSGGQMRLLEIARTLTSGKDMFLLDEPTAGVSPKMTQQVADIIMKLKDEKKTVLIIEHDLPFISRICDHVVVLDVGEVVLQGTPKEVKASKELQQIYFGADPTN